jgi:hypothetical protein
MALPMKLRYLAPIQQTMKCLVDAGVPVPSAAVMNFPKLALSMRVILLVDVGDQRSLCVVND